MKMRLVAIARGLLMFFLLAGALLFTGTDSSAQPPGEGERIRIIPLPEPSEPVQSLTAFSKGGRSMAAEPKAVQLAKRLKELKGSRGQRPASVTSGTPRKSSVSALPPQAGGSSRATMKKDLPLSPLSKQGKGEAKTAALAAGPSPAVVEEDGLSVRMRAIGTPRQIKVEGKAREESKLLPSARTLPESEADELKVRSFLDKYCSYLRLDDPGNELRLSSKDSDELQRRHFRFQQMHRGLPVWPAELTVHLDPEGAVDLVDGAYVPTPRNLGTNPAVTPEQAVTAARAPLSAGAEAKENRENRENRGRPFVHAFLTSKGKQGTSIRSCVPPLQCYTIA